MPTPNYKKELENLTKGIASFIRSMDKIMKMPSSYKRGEAIGKIIHKLEFANDSIMHFTLGWGWKKIENVKREKKNGN